MDEPRPRTWKRRLGFAVKVAGRERLKSNDARKWQSGPHLSVSIGYLRDILDYAHEIGVTMYRISSDFVPYCTHPDLPQFHGQIAECRDDLAELGRTARERGIRLSLHPSQYVLLSAQDPAINAKGIADVNAPGRAARRDGAGPRGRGHPPPGRRVRRQGRGHGALRGEPCAPAPRPAAGGW